MSVYEVVNDILQFLFKKFIQREHNCNTATNSLNELFQNYKPTRGNTENK